MSIRLGRTFRCAMLCCTIALMCGLPIGCGGSGDTKEGNPAEVEKLRQEHEDMSQREMSNEG